jgi:hypothetical protein
MSIILMEVNCSLYQRVPFFAENAQKSLAAGVSPQIPLGELTGPTYLLPDLREGGKEIWE